MHTSLKNSIVVCGLAFALGATAPVVAFAADGEGSSEVSPIVASAPNEGAMTAAAPDTNGPADLNADSPMGGEDQAQNSSEDKKEEEVSVEEQKNPEASVVTPTEPNEEEEITAPRHMATARRETPQSQPLANGTYVIGSGNYRGLSKVIDVWHNKEHDHANVQIYENNNSEAQQWDLTYKGDGYYSIAKHGTNLMLQVNTQEKNNIEICQEQVDSDAQLWFLKRLANGAYSIVSKLNEGQVLDVYGGKVENESNIWLYKSNGTLAQRFYFYKAHPEVAPSDIDKKNGAYLIKATANSSCLVGIKGSSKLNGANAQLARRVSGDQAQKIYLQTAGEGYYYLNVLGSGKVLTMKNSVVAGSNVYQDAKRGQDNQKWALRGNTDGSCCLVNKATGLVLDISGGHARSGTNLQGFVANNSAAQNFSLDKVSLLDEGIYTISNLLNPHKVLDVQSGSNKSGAMVRMYNSNGTRAQRFEVKLIEANEGLYRIRTASSGGWVTYDPVSGRIIQNGSSSTVADGNNQWVIGWNGTQLSLYHAADTNKALNMTGDGSTLSLAAANGSASQNFIFDTAQLIANGTYKVVSQLGTVLGAGRTDNRNGGNITAGRFKNYDSQKFQIINVGNGCITLKNVNSDKMVDVYHGSGANGANVNQYKSNATPAQMWKAEIADGGWISFRNLGSGLMMDIAGASKRDGANIHQWESNNTAAQKWTFQDTSHWDLSNGNYVYVNERGKRSRWQYTTYASYRRINNLSSGTKYLIALDQSRFYVNVYHLENGTWAPHKSFLCAVGRPGSPTPKGLFRSTGRKDYYGDIGPSGIVYETGEYYWTYFPNGLIFHSRLYYAKTHTLYPYVNRLGARQSGACCRLEIGNAKWIFDNISRGTTALSY